MTHVDYCEDHPEESFLQTVQSTRNMARLAQSLKATLIYVSTDYVFDGVKGPYSEEAEPNPLSVYGRHKLEAEEIIKAEADKWLIVRITNVYGDELRGKNFISRLITACHNNVAKTFSLPVDQFATPINAKNVAHALWKLISDDKRGLYHLSSTDYLNRVQLANKVISYFPGHKIKIIPVSTQELHQKAKRPLSGGLIAGKFLGEYPNFQFESVDNYLSQK
jgi:dTDP-4-dehydrorhamnose reductase